MATVPPRTERRRARPGSMERPVNGRLYRGTWLLVGLPLLVAAFSVARPTPLPRAFLPEFDGETTKQLATDVVTLHANRFPEPVGGAERAREAVGVQRDEGGRELHRRLAVELRQERPRQRRRSGDAESGDEQRQA